MVGIISLLCKSLEEEFCHFTKENFKSFSDSFVKAVTT